MWSRRPRPAEPAGAVLVLDIKGMHCGSCGLTIDDALEDVPGVARATTSFRTGLAEIVLADGADPAVVAPDVVAAVAGAGYSCAVSPPVRLVTPPRSPGPTR